MKAKIGIADSEKVIEIEIDDPVSFKSTMEALMSADGPLIWLEDTMGRQVGIPKARVAFVELESQRAKPSVGFGP